MAYADWLCALTDRAPRANGLRGGLQRLDIDGMGHLLYVN